MDELKPKRGEKQEVDESHLFCNSLGGSPVIPCEHHWMNTQLFQSFHYNSSLPFQWISNTHQPDKITIKCHKNACFCIRFQVYQEIFGFWRNGYAIFSNQSTVSDLSKYFFSQ